MKLEVSSLSKTIENKVILKDIDLQLLPGQCLALKGSNGSGKTSLIRIIAGLDKECSGTIRHIGYDAKNDIGYIPQDIVLFDELTVFDNLRIFFDKKKNSDFDTRISGLNRLFCMDDIMKRRLGKLSGGKKRLINTLAGVLNDPKLILMDEPTVGLDEVTVNRLICLINEIKGNRMMILCSHQEDFLQKTCMGFIRLFEGSVMEEGKYG